MRFIAFFSVAFGVRRAARGCGLVAEPHEPRAAAELARRQQVGRRRHRRARPQHRRDRQHQGQHALPDGEHGQGRDRRALSRAGRQWPPLARRHDQRAVGAQPDGADADPQRQSRDRHPAQGPRRPDAVHDWLARQWRHRPSRRPHDRPAAAAASATCGTAAIRALRSRWSTCSGASTRPS